MVQVTQGGAVMYMHWRRELAIRESQQLETLRGTWFWSQAMTDLSLTEAELYQDSHYVRMVAARAQQLKQEAEGLCN